MGEVTVKERRRRGKRNGPGPSAGDKPSPNHHAKSASAHDTHPPTGGAAPAPGYKPHSTLLVQFTEETPTWYECGRNTAGRDETVFGGDQTRPSPAGNTREIVAKYRRWADEVYGQEVALARRSPGGGSAAGCSEQDEQWVENTARRGTLKDRIAAMSVVVGLDCLHKLHALDLLLDLAGCGVGGDGAAPNARVGRMASEALADLFAHTLLPRDRKLIALDRRPLSSYEGPGRTLSPRVLLLWRYEEMLQLRYASYLSRYLAKTLAGEDADSKKSALTTAAALLLQLPEGEEGLLTMIVNKIGDPCRKIACAAGHQLRRVLEEHPSMVQVVAREVQQLTHRPHLSPRALYNCVVFLNQLQLSREDDTPTPNDANAARDVSLPASLINTYFHLFETSVKKDAKQKQGTAKEEASGSRLLSALLTGVNRAHPYLQQDAAMARHVDALYRISHTAPPAAATQALMLLFQLAVGSGAPAGDAATAGEEDAARKDRFYRALYSKLVDGDMFAGRQLTLFFNLLYKAMKYDASLDRVAAFAKRLLHTALHLPSSVLCGSLFLFSEIARGRPELRGAGAAPAAQVPFDPAKREPRAAFAGTVAAIPNMWELSLLAHHFHPSVVMFTAGSGGEISYGGDPLKDFALSPFLDKFAFKNPKSLDRLSKRLKRGESVAERKSGLSGTTALPLNDPSYLAAPKIAEEEQFFHQFFVERARRDGLKGIVRGGGADQEKKDDSDLEDEALNATEADEVGDAVDDMEGDTDSEEEAFVNQLAEKLMESTANGKANLDAEDPDMDDWSDVDDSDNEREDGTVEDDEEDDEEGDEDAFMNASSSLEGEESDSEGFDGEADVPFGTPGEDGSGDGSEDGSEDGAPRPSSKQGDRRQQKRKKPSSVFADAEEYEKILEEEAARRRQEHGDGSDPEVDRSPKKKKKGRKKR